MPRLSDFGGQRLELSWRAGHRSVRAVGVAGFVLAVARLPAIKTLVSGCACFLPHRSLTSHSRSPAAAGSDRRTKRREFPAAAVSGGPLNSTLCAMRNFACNPVLHGLLSFGLFAGVAAQSSSIFAGFVSAVAFSALSGWLKVSCSLFSVGAFSAFVAWVVVGVLLGQESSAVITAPLVLLISSTALVVGYVVGHGFRKALAHNK